MGRDLQLHLLLRGQLPHHGLRQDAAGLAERRLPLDLEPPQIRRRLRRVGAAGLEMIGTHSGVPTDALTVGARVVAQHRWRPPSVHTHHAP